MPAHRTEVICFQPATRGSWLTGGKMSCDRAAEMSPTENMMSTGPGTGLTARIFFPMPYSTCCVNFKFCLSPMSGLLRQRDVQDTTSLPSVQH